VSKCTHGVGMHETCWDCFRSVQKQFESVGYILVKPTTAVSAGKHGRNPRPFCPTDAYRDLLSPEVRERVGMLHRGELDVEAELARVEASQT
jgi:hypothetical protein